MNRAKRDGGRTAPSCRAAIGGTRVARCAGITAESTVTTMPTARAMTTVRGCITRPLRGMSKPAAWKTWLTPAATPSPAKSPSTEARMPMTSASPVMLQSTCAREAPSARSIANSRRRCATVMENALKMMNAPTSTAMPPKLSSTGRRNAPMASLSCLGLVGGGLRAGLDLGVRGQRGPDALRERVGRDARVGLRVDLGQAPLHAEPALRVGERRVR